MERVVATLVDASGRVRPAPGDLRRVLSADLARLGGEVLGRVHVVCAELLANAQVHGGGVAAVRVHLTADDAVCVEVDDRDPALPAVLDFDLERTGGRGMVLVAALSEVWGVSTRSEGKTVWAVLRARPAGAGGAGV
ncbi:hypothetical protein BJP25_19850 [Actinokineospora bangkokensis]|uniref:Histidine kinase/HSP90-like ATPase domain-containing protein n=1 Tax=Actinokineospora bangkokensis TaxID=1193682 RepID=A0A1Q9LL03_9PSEU|nr:hypothetical protein BJP25_19850 [Actinokineospora bangkokensis]